MVQKSGLRFLIQQINALILKRFFIFTRRYILAAITLFLPLTLEVIICCIIPSGTNLADSIIGTKNAGGASYNLQMENYESFIMPYSLNGDSAMFQNLLSSFYTNSNRPGITIQNCTFDNVSSTVLQLRKDNIQNLVSNYYTGMSINIVNSTTLYANAYYSSFAYHSPGTIINEISNLILAYYSSNNLSQSIKTINKPITSSSSQTGNSFLSFLPCLDTLPLSILNFINSIIVALIISIIVVHVGRERVNGSKGLQLLSGTHYFTYWMANHIFDLTICLFNILTMVFTLKIINSIRNDSSVEIYTIGSNQNISYFFLLLFISMFR